MFVFLGGELKTKAMNLRKGPVGTGIDRGMCGGNEDSRESN